VQCAMDTWAMFLPERVLTPPRTRGTASMARYLGSDLRRKMLMEMEAHPIEFNLDESFISIFSICDHKFFGNDPDQLFVSGPVFCD